MKRDYDALSETLKGLQQTVLGDARAARDSSLAPADIGELVLAELRTRRERLKNLIRLLNEEARLSENHGRTSVGRHKCRRHSHPVC